MKQTIKVEVLDGPGPNKTVNVEAALTVGTLCYSVVVTPPRFHPAAGTPEELLARNEAGRRFALREALTHMAQDPRFPI
ncbi:hypothetical protein D3C87_1018380 [compost metagenome]